MRRQRLLSQLLHALHPAQPERIYLFGSFARGEEDELSDLDVVVIQRTTLSFLERLREIARYLPPTLEWWMCWCIRPGNLLAAMLANGNAFAEMIAEEGRLVYDQRA